MELFLSLFIFMIGAVVGSFLGVIIYRLPRGESIVHGRSHCDHCNKKLTALDLVPLFSFLFLGGKCRHCKTKLSWFYPFVEAITGILFVLVAFHTGMLSQEISSANMVAFFYYIFIVSILITLFFIDLKHGILPFSLIAPAIVVSFGYTLLTMNTMIFNVLLAAVGAFLFFLILFLATRGRGMGFGDVVYVILMGLVLGFPKIVLGLYIAFVSGALIALILVWMHKKNLKGGIIPFGPFLVAGTVISIFWGQQMIDMVMVYLTN